MKKLNKNYFILVLAALCLSLTFKGKSKLTDTQLLLENEKSSVNIFQFYKTHTAFHLYHRAARRPRNFKQHPMGKPKTELQKYSITLEVLPREALRHTFCLKSTRARRRALLQHRMEKT